MANVIDYLEWRGDLTFTQSAPNEVDNVLFVFLTFLDFTDIVPRTLGEDSVTLGEAVRRYFDELKSNEAYYGAIMPNKDIQRMAKLMAKSNRFADVRLSGFLNEINSETEEQFSAFTALLDDGSAFISFKGTDDTLVGWKEDMNMSVSEVIPGQRRAAEYLNSAADVFKGKIRVGGHSKGGNFAIYAAACCREDVQKRIVRVYNNDGPGFSKAFFESDEYKRIKTRVMKLVPQESIIGQLLYNDDNFIVVSSRKTGVVQHNSYLWEVRGKHFVRRGALTRKSVETGRAFNKWIEEKDFETRKLLVETVYGILTAGDAKTLTDLGRGQTKILKALADLDPKKRDMVFKSLMQLVGELIRCQMSMPKGADTK